MNVYGVNNNITTNNTPLDRSGQEQEDEGGLGQERGDKGQSGTPGQNNVLLPWSGWTLNQL